MSPVPTDEDEQTEKDSITKIKITRKIKNDKKTTVSVDTENNQIIGKRSEKDILEDKLKQVSALFIYSLLYNWSFFANNDVITRHYNQYDS